MHHKRIIGLIVNPVAGMGGSVGLKGTDGQMYRKALEMGAEPVTPNKTKEFLTHIKSTDRVSLLVAPGAMGADHVGGTDLEFNVIGQTGAETTSADTKRIALEMLWAKTELLVFVGGDGTARDIRDAIDLQLPVVAVPGGVKVYSAVFATNARTAAQMVDAFVDDTTSTEEEVLDIDEDAFRKGRLDSTLYGYLLIPELPRLHQAGKHASDLTVSEAAAKEEIAEYVVEQLDDETLCLLGPGTTVKAIAEQIGVPKTLLGVDAVLGGRLVGEDLNEQAVLELLDRYPDRKLIVTPLGGNGFIFGRGNKQFTPQVIRRIGKDHIIVVATRDKLGTIDCLRVDTDDPGLDQELAGYTEVVVGYNRLKMLRVEC